jgi:Sec-independent protein secretion pathway component TatC
MIIIILFPILLYIILKFLKKKVSEKSRKKLINYLLISNALVFLSPLIYAFIMSLPNGNMWNENGPGAALWLYLILIPICSLVLIILLILKFVENKKTDPKNN